MLDITALTIASRDKILVRDLSLHLPARGVTVLIGPSGCGKSSVLKWIAGVLPKTLTVQGRLQVKDRPITPPDPAIAYQPQSDALFPWLSLAENAALGLRIAGLSAPAARARVHGAFAPFGLEGLQNHYPAEISGGMRQRVAFLRTMLCDTPLVLLDEPFSALDAVTRLRMQDWLVERLHQTPRSVLLVTHDLHEATQLADRILVMAAAPGRIIADIALERPPAQRSELDLAPLRARLKSLLLEERPS